MLDRFASVPVFGPSSLVVSPRERPFVTRACVSGTAWASIWLPGLVRERDKEQIRLAPISHAQVAGPHRRGQTVDRRAPSPKQTTGS